MSDRESPRPPISRGTHHTLLPLRSHGPSDPRLIRLAEHRADQGHHYDPNNPSPASTMRAQEPEPDQEMVPPRPSQARRAAQSAPPTVPPQPLPGLSRSSFTNSSHQDPVAYAGAVHRLVDLLSQLRQDRQQQRRGPSSAPAGAMGVDDVDSDDMPLAVTRMPPHVHHHTREDIDRVQGMCWLKSRLKYEALYRWLMEIHEGMGGVEYYRNMREKIDDTGSGVDGKMLGH